MKENKIIAHRGVFDNEKVIENTIPSFKKAVQYHYPIELDVQLTTDNQIVVFHDDDLKRLAKKNGIIQEMKYSELKKIKLGKTTSHIPLLSEVLPIINEKVLLDIEIKPTKRRKDTLFYLMKELENYHNYYLKSFDPRIIRMVKKMNPSIQTGLLIHDHYPHLFQQVICHSKFILKYSKCNFVAISRKLLKNKKKMKNFSNYQVFVWTIKKKEDIHYDDDYVYVCNNLPYEK